MSLRRRVSEKFTVYILGKCLLMSSLTSCYFFRKRDTGGEENQVSSLASGQNIGVRAGNANSSQLNAVYAVATSHAPAGIRPDPDVFVRNLLLQFRDQGSTVARQIGRVENYRLLLGGASKDFSVAPQESYDATSLLAKLKVAEEVCEGLVNPNSSSHPGWLSILPSDPSNSSANISFLVQRISGMPSDEITSEIVDQLEDILNASQVDGRLTNASYVLVCATLIIDAGSLLL